MIQVGGFDLLFGWTGFIFLLVILGCFVLRSHADVFEEAERQTSDRAESAAVEQDKLNKALLRTDAEKR